MLPFFSQRRAGKSATNLDGWGRSGQWLVESFANKTGREFDHVYLWEKNGPTSLIECATECFQSIYFGNLLFFFFSRYLASGVPVRLHDKMSFYHTAKGIDAHAADETNPLVVLRRECKEVDYCVVKCDFDNDAVEKEIIAAVADVSENGVGRLVDEFFMDPVDVELEAYATLLHLRKNGIRAHGWV